MSFNKKIKKNITVAVSGGFDPIHVGHVRLFKEAKKYGNKLIVMLNNDNWLKLKKGHVFMPEKERAEIILSSDSVDEVILTDHSKNTKDMSVCSTLTKIKPDIFANGGDRKEDNIPEYAICEKLGIKMVFNIGGGKIQSSSWLVDKAKKHKNKIQKNIIIADVDGTICYSCQKISIEMAKQISKMIKKGFEFAFISGTKNDDLKKMISFRLKEKHHLLGTTGTDYIIVENKSSKKIYNYSFNDKEKKEIIKAFQKLVKYFNIKTLTNEKDQIQDRGSQITFSAIGRNAPTYLKKEYDLDNNKRKVWIKFLIKLLGKNKYNINIGGTTSIDITKKGLDKEKGIKLFLEKNNFNANNVLFLGDNIYPGGNDYPATNIVDCIAVKNPKDTLDKLKKIEVNDFKKISFYEKIVDNIKEKIKKIKPWGNYEQFTLNETTTIKILTIEPKQKLSLQYHNNRYEFWKFLDNPAKVTLGERIIIVKKDSEIIVPPKTNHRIEALSKPVRVLEISYGFFDENDITRIKDAYGRTKK